MPSRRFRRPCRAAVAVALLSAIIVPPGSASAVTEGGADLGIDKSGPDVVVAGDAFSYDLTVTNLGDSANSGGYTVTDVLPTGLTYVSGPAACTATAEEGVTTVECVSDGIDVGSENAQTFAIEVQAAANLEPGLESLSNTASVAPDSESDLDGNASNDDATKVSDVEAEADLFPTLSAPTGSEVAGTSFQYTLRVDNAGPSHHSGAFEASFSLPSGFTFAGGAGCEASGANVSCAGASIDAGAHASFTVGVDVSSSVAAGSYATSGLLVSSSGTTDPLSANNSGSPASVSVVTSADVSVTKEGSPNPVISGNDITYAVEVSNAGPSDAQDVVLGDNLPAALTDGRICEIAGEVDCTAETDFAPFDGSEALGTMAADAERSFRIRATVNAGTPDGLDSLANTATVSSSTNDPVANNDGVDFTSTITEADLSVEMTGPEAQVVAGDDAGFDIEVTVANAGPSHNTGGYDVSFTLPAAFTFSGEGDCTAAGQAVTCSNETGLAAAGSDPYTVHVEVAPQVQDDTYSTSPATVTSAGTTDPNDTNDTAAAVSVDVITRADLRPTLTTATTDRIAGALAGFDYTLTVTNDGPSDNSDGGYSASFTIPTGISFSSTGTTSGCSAVGQVVTCTDTGGIAAGDSESFTVHATVPSSASEGSYESSTATVTTLGTIDPSTTNNTSSTATVNVITRANLSITTSALAQVAANLAYANMNAAQNRVTFSITVSNAAPSSAGPSDAQAVTVTDVLPTGTSFVSASSPDCSYASGTRTVTCTNSAALTPGSSRTYTIIVSVDATLRGGEANNFTNTAVVTSPTKDIVTNAPTSKSATSGTIRVHTVPDPPTTVTAIPGNGNAVVYWPPVVEAGSAARNETGGTPVTSYRLTTVPLDGGAAPGVQTVSNTVLNSTELGQIVQAQVGSDGGTTLTNTKRYVFDLVAVNAVGYGTAATDATRSNEMRPDANLSAKILTGNATQTTGTGAVSNNDAIIAKQSGSFGTGSAIGTLVEISGSSSALRASYLSAALPTAANFCGGEPCDGNTVVLHKLTDFATNRYIVEIQYSKAVITNTGIRTIWFDATPDTAGDAIPLPDCPKSGPTGDACKLKLVENRSKNPALLVQISVARNVIDPVSATSKR